MKLDPELAQEVRERLGRKTLPSPNSDEFKELLAHLLETDPETGALLQSAIYSDQLGDIEVEARKHAQRDQQRRRIHQKLFQRHDDITGEWHTSKTKMLGWFTAGSLFGIWLLFGSSSLLMRGEGETEAAAPQAPALTAQTGQATPPQDQDPFTDVVEQTNVDERATDAFANANTSQQPMIQIQSGNQEPATQAETSETSGGTEAIMDDPMLLNSEDPMLPSTDEEAGLAVFTRQGAGGELVAYRGGQSGNTQTSSGTGDPFAEEQPNSEQATPVGLSVYQKPNPEDQEVTTALRVFQAGVPEARPNLYTTPQQQAANENNPSANPQPTELNPAATNDTLVQVSQPVAQRIAQANSTATQPKASPYKTGQELEARLQLGVVAIDDTPLPVLAQANNGSIWSGQASLTPTGRVDIRFYEVLDSSGSHPVNAIAQANDGYLGLQTQVQETTPALASDLARSALRGVADYAQALGNESNVSIADGAAIISRDAPPLEASVAGSVARLFTPPEGDSQQALVRLAQVPADSILKVVVLSPNSASSFSQGDD